MKQAKKTAVARKKPITHSSRPTSTRRSVHASRPLHRRISLHPLSLLGLLSVGVLLATTTLQAMAGTITVTATNPAPPLTEPAIITYPSDGSTFTTGALTVSGTCPDNSYVNLTDNGTFVGTDTCTNLTFQIGVDMSSGTNEFQAQDYNITDAPGPASSPVTVTYTPPTPPPTSGSTTPPSNTATPRALVITQVDIGVPYPPVRSTIPVVSEHPTLAGIAPSGSAVVISFFPGSTSCQTTANEYGYWSCRVVKALTSGEYTVDARAVTPAGQVLTHAPFEIRASGESALVPTKPAPFYITSTYTYTIHSVGQVVNYSIRIVGGRAPYAFTILWGDGAATTLVREDASTFTISHAYGWFNKKFQDRTIRIEAVDAPGQVATLQLIAPVRNPAYVGSTKMTWSTFFADLRPWLWLLWPGYAIILLMVFSFWLGERQELAILAKRRQKRRPAHAHH